ncbi:fatty acid-binding protein, intestinal-like [Microcaecilia unicolor]|uniref:Fatty acid-binding protein, intestinal-like n=1 Tax=Microcaecilia unicolor TaxID=1415580 RepID=A0A6P7X7Y8_9AMPH|nr:fatty acid-binding protein, intestinal-like [Microcaecilia unicolor]
MAFDGTWTLAHNENYLKLLESMGLDAEKRQLAAYDHMKLKIKQNGKQISVHESSDYSAVDIVFGQKFKHSLYDEIELVGEWKLKGDIIEGNFTRKDNKKVLKTQLEIVGGELVQTLSYEGVKAKRIFVRE